MPLTCPLDGSLNDYTFGTGYGVWKVSAVSLARAVRLFRVGALFPEKYADQEGTVPVSAYVEGRWMEVARIPPQGADDLDPRMLALLGQDGIPGAETVTALAPAGAETGLRNAGRAALEEKTREVESAIAALEQQKHALEQHMSAIKAELARRMESIWLIELFLGSHEQVKMIRDGDPAPLGTPIAVRQQVLCMDEEIAVHDWLKTPGRVGTFDHKDIGDFDRWLCENPEGLETICPWQKGIVGLRVRRLDKERRPADNLEDLYRQAQETAADRMTYLLVRNGEKLYRLWVDVNVWPRLFANEEEAATAAGGGPVDPEDSFSDFRRKSNAESAQRVLKQQIAGLIALQGILERSDLLHPLLPGTNVFDPTQSERFLLVRDAEAAWGLTDDSDQLSRVRWEDTKIWDPKEPVYSVTHGGPDSGKRKVEYTGAWVTAEQGYKNWLKSQLVSGVRVLYTGTRYSGKDRYDTLEYRLDWKKGIHTWPKHGEPYTLDEVGSSRYYFYYLPDQKVYVPDSEWSRGRIAQPRKRRVRFFAYESEVVPVDFLSWRVLEHLIRDRSQRAEYGKFFRLAFHYWKIAKAESERERPFVDLVLRRCGINQDDDSERARCERLLRWWKIKVKEYRTLGTDEAKALRMIEAAMKRGDDQDNDPEVKLLKAIRRVA